MVVDMFKTQTNHSGFLSCLRGPTHSKVNSANSMKAAAAWVGQHRSACEKPCSTPVTLINAVRELQAKTYVMYIYSFWVSCPSRGLHAAGRLLGLGWADLHLSREALQGEKSSRACEMVEQLLKASVLGGAVGSGFLPESANVAARGTGAPGKARSTRPPSTIRCCTSTCCRQRFLL